MCPGGECSWCSWQQVLATDTLSSYTHDYPTLPADVAEAIYPIYEELSNVKLLERCTAAHAYVNKEDAERVMISGATVHGSTREGRMARRQQQVDLLDATDTAEGPSYSPVIGDNM
ncbi:uncharacterized protein TNIN_498611 [Trichonephila inaurata madagascariensis]|uniref:Uncharacterized protein n=1 Tax=Trichonephila inaurata madagascariensis TaxID=2747483 RepID=A0A8X7CJJ8_9ARAC|nr:uncharacterized protein TNIN_498611 [Trichonephila inaurata madagascariensis]